MELLELRITALRAPMTLELLNPLPSLERVLCCKEINSLDFCLSASLCVGVHVPDAMSG